MGKGRGKAHPASGGGCEAKAVEEDRETLMGWGGLLIWMMLGEINCAVLTLKLTLGSPKSKKLRPNKRRPRQCRAPSTPAVDTACIRGDATRVEEEQKWVGEHSFPGSAVP